MLSRLHRFHGLNSLSYAYKHGQVVRGPEFALKYALNKRRNTYRAAVVVSRKVHKSAVVRNRIRRRIYEVIRSQEAQIQQPYDMVITAFNADLAELNTKALEEFVGTMLKQAGIVDGTPKEVTHGIVDQRKLREKP